MNIFILDENPTSAAESLCDKHIVKMILESAQMLCTAIPIAREYQMYCGITLYKPTHINHPCTLWVGRSQENFSWLCSHAKAMCQEYTRRYKKDHKSEQVINAMMVLNSRYQLPSIGLTPFAQAMPDQYKDASAVVAYRNYYIGEKSKIAVWKHSTPPSWWKEVLK